jgi:hypothetical protein
MSRPGFAFTDCLTHRELFAARVNRLYDTTMDLAQFAANVRRLAESGPGWPFVCDGSPFDCEVFLVGINPAANVPIWPHWLDGSGMNKAGWLTNYLNTHSKFTPTRSRIERLGRALRPTQLLETNIFPHHSPREHDLPHHLKRTDVFDFLLATLKPRILFVHGRSAVAHIKHLTGTELERGRFVSVRYQDVPVEVISGHHLSYQWSFAKVEALAGELRRKLEDGKAL